MTNGRFDKKDIFRVIKKELDRPERESNDLYNAFLNNEMTQEELDIAMKGLDGFGIWWGAEASCGLAEIEIKSEEEVEKGLFEIKVSAELHRASARVVTEDTPPDVHHAVITIRIDEKLMLKDFDFKWN